MPKIILLADDSITIQKVVELTFSDADYEVIATNNGARAIEKLAEVRPDIVLADIIMPEKNGYEVCEYVKSHPDFRDIPVILLTGTFEPFDPERAERAGCDAVVTKPFESQGLIQKVEDLILARASQSEPEPVSTPEPESIPPPEDDEIGDELLAQEFDAVTQPNVSIPAIPDDFFDTPPSPPVSDDIWSPEITEPVEELDEPEDTEESASDRETESSAGIFEAPPSPSLPPVDESLIDESPFTTVTAIEPIPFSEPEPFVDSRSAPTSDDLFEPAPDEIDTAVSPAPTPEEIFSAEEPSIFDASKPDAAPDTPSYDFGSETRAFNRSSFADVLAQSVPQEAVASPTPPDDIIEIQDPFEESPLEVFPDDEAPAEEIEEAPLTLQSFPSTSTPFEEMEDIEPEPPTSEPLVLMDEPESVLEEPFAQDPEPENADSVPAVEEAASLDEHSPLFETEPEPEPQSEPLALMAEPEPVAEDEAEPEPEAEPGLEPEAEPEPLALMAELEPEAEPEPEVEAEPFEDVPVAEAEPQELAPDEPEEISSEAIVEEPELAVAENEGMGAVEAAPATTGAPESEVSSIGPAGLTDADVDRIAKRMVEMLSDRTIREIAWEVIPDLAESIVRDRIRELESEE